MKKKYKVVCTKSQFSGEQYIDIAPAEGVIHDQILYSRVQLHKQTETYLLSKVMSSIYLSDDNGDISVEFPKSQTAENTPEYKKEQRLKDLLEPQIIRQYKDMRAAGNNSTLQICDINEMYALDEYEDIAYAPYDDFDDVSLQAMEKSANLRERLKHTETPTPQSPQEEQAQITRERKNHSAHTREQTQEYLRRRDEKYSKYNLTSLQIKQLLHRDY